MKCHWSIAKQNKNLNAQSIVLPVNGTANVTGNNDNNIFTVTDTKWHVPVVSLSARNNQKSFLVKDLKDQFTRMNIKQKVIIEIQ